MFQSNRFFKDFCVAEIKLDDIELRANFIARRVRCELARGLQGKGIDIEIAMEDVEVQAGMTQNQRLLKSWNSTKGQWCCNSPLMRKKMKK